MNLYFILKRLMDIFGAIVGIILFSPIMVLAALWIIIQSPTGGILADIPKRVGKGGRMFRFFKFRSMIPNAHQWLLDHPEWYKKYQENGYKLDPKEDPRFIKGAEFMRKYSIDELPQFFNILIGDMSLVGPRAYYDFELDAQVKKYEGTEQYVPAVKSVKPGLTGVWQISGRSKIPFDGRIKLDAEYAKNRSIMYDLLIVLKTPYVVVTSKGAY